MFTRLKYTRLLSNHKSTVSLTSYNNGFVYCIYTQCNHVYLIFAINTLFYIVYVEDERNCLVTCDIKGSIRSTSNCTSQCQSTDDSKISNSIDKEGQLDWSKQFSFCCENSGRIVSIKGRCDYTVYGTYRQYVYSMYIVRIVPMCRIK